MKKVILPLSYFLAGFVLMAFFQMLTQCNHDDDFLKNSISKNETKDQIDYKAIENAKDQVQTALENADENSLNDLIIFDYRAFYQNSETAYTAEEMTTIGVAIKKAKLTAVTPNFAEYTYKIDKVEYTFTMALDDGTWKIANF